MRVRLLAPLAFVPVVPVLAGVLACTAFAYRPATAGELAGMKAALTRRDCVAHAVHVTEAFVSTANPRYGQANCGQGGHFAVFLRRPSSGSERWRAVFEIGDGAVDCSTVRSHLPEAVIRDFGIGGLTANGKAGHCAPPTSSHGYATAKSEWKAAPCQPAAIQGAYWRRAAHDLARRPQHGGSARAIGELNTLASLPETSETPAQMREFTSVTRALNRFFDTPGNLIGTDRYCS